jgi:hypothetical protein
LREVNHFGFPRGLQHPFPVASSISRTGRFVSLTGYSFENDRHRKGWQLDWGPLSFHVSVRRAK